MDVWPTWVVSYDGDLLVDLISQGKIWETSQNVGQWGQIGKHLIQLLIFLMFPSNLSMLSHLSFQQANCVSDGRLISSKALWKATSKIEYGSNFLDSQQLYNIQIYHLQWILSRYMILSWHRDFDPWPRYNAFDGCWWGSFFSHSSWGSSLSVAGKLRHRCPTKRINEQSHWALRFEFWQHETLKPLFKARCAPKILQVAVLWKIANDMWVMWMFRSHSAWMLQYSTVCHGQLIG